MKITFEDKSYIELTKSEHSDKVIITIVARSNSNDLTTIANSVELTIEQLTKLIDLK